jgi:ADP-ribosylglycohydrolase
MAGGGPFNLSPGEWTDDTAMALCLARSLISKRAFDPMDQMKRFSRWARDGYLSSNGLAFDIGNTVQSALARFENKPEPFCGSTHPSTAGNGSLMRLAPVPLFFGQSPLDAIEFSGQSSRTTHGAKAAIDACRYMGALITGALAGVSKGELLSERFCPVEGYWQENPLAPEIDEIALGSFKRRKPPEIRATGYVVHTLEAALWAFNRGDSFREACLLAVNLGEDADTTGAVFGQLAGAYYGENEIPTAWRQKVARRKLIESYADQLCALSGFRGVESV